MISTSATVFATLRFRERETIVSLQSRQRYERVTTKGTNFKEILFFRNGIIFLGFSPVYPTLLLLANDTTSCRSIEDKLEGLSYHDVLELVSSLFSDGYLAPMSRISDDYVFDADYRLPSSNLLRISDYELFTYNVN